MTRGEADALLALWGPLAAALVLAVANWLAVWTGGRAGLAVERVTKPAVIAWLLVAAVAAHAWTPEASAARPFLVAGLLASLAGDVLLLPPSRLVAGLAAFLVGHLAYLGAFLQLAASDAAWLAGGAMAAALVAATAGRVLVRAAGRAGLGRPVLGYVGAILVMAVVATGTTRPAAIAGAWLFVVSDALLGWARFRGPRPASARGGGRALATAVMATYHLAQALILVAVLGGG